MNNEIQSVFNMPRTPILELSVLNYFVLNDNRLENITFKKVFSDDGDFCQNFIEGLDEYLEEKAKLLGISEDKIEKMLTN